MVGAIFSVYSLNRILFSLRYHTYNEYFYCGQLHFAVRDWKIEFGSVNTH